MYNLHVIVSGQFYLESRGIRYRVAEKGVGNQKRDMRQELVVVVQSLSRVQLVRPCGQRSLAGYSPWDSPARILEWIAISFSRGSSRLRNQTQAPVSQADSLPTKLQGKPKLGLKKLVHKLRSLSFILKITENLQDFYQGIDMI